MLFASFEKRFPCVVLMLAALLVFEPLSLVAFAQSQDDCAIRLRDARNRFNRADFDGSIAIVQECLKLKNLSEGAKINSCELLARSYLANKDDAKAIAAIAELLKLNPNYEAPADAPRFAAAVNRAKKEIAAQQEQQVEQPQPKQTLADTTKTIVKAQISESPKVRKFDTEKSEGSLWAWLADIPLINPISPPEGEKNFGNRKSWKWEVAVISVNRK
jgi:hypothetical protein